MEGPHGKGPDEVPALDDVCPFFMRLLIIGINIKNTFLIYSPYFSTIIVSEPAGSVLFD